VVGLNPNPRGVFAAAKNNHNTAAAQAGIGLNYEAIGQGFPSEASHIAARTQNAVGLGQRQLGFFKDALSEDFVIGDLNRAMRV